MEDSDKREISISMLAMNIKLVDSIMQGSASAEEIRDAAFNGMVMAVGSDIFNEAADLAGVSVNIWGSNIKNC